MTVYDTRDDGPLRSIVHQDFRFSGSASKELEPYLKVSANDTEFFSSYNPELIEKKLVKYIEDVLDTTCIISDKKFKIKFE